MLVYYPYLQDTLSVQLSSSATEMKLTTHDICSDIGGGNYTFLDISDGVNLEVVKAYDCADGCVLIERDVLGTGSFAFGISACVSFSNKMPTIQAIVCELIANIKEECGEIPWVCHIEGDESIVVSDVGDCGKQLTFNPSTISEYQLCAEAALEVPLENEHKIAVCVDGNVFLTTVQDICAFIIAKLGPEIEYVSDILPGDGVTITGAGAKTVSLTPIFGGNKTLTGGAIVNKFGQFINIPTGWPFGTSATLPNGTYTNANVTVSGGVVTNVTSGAASGGVDSVVPGTGIGVSGTPSDPVVTILNTGVTAGTYGPIVVNLQGQITQMLSGYDFYKSVDANAPLSASTVAGVRTIEHLTSAVTPGTYNSVTVDSYGHVTAGTQEKFETQWVGTANAFGQLRNSGMTAVDVGAGVIDFTFTTPFPASNYHVHLTSDAGASATISSRTANGFRADFSTSTDVFYITVIYLA